MRGEGKLCEGLRGVEGRQYKAACSGVVANDYAQIVRMANSSLALEKVNALF